MQRSRSRVLARATASRSGRSCGLAKVSSRRFGDSDMVIYGYACGSVKRSRIPFAKWPPSAVSGVLEARDRYNYVESKSFREEPRRRLVVPGIAVDFRRFALRTRLVSRSPSAIRSKINICERRSVHKTRCSIDAALSWRRIFSSDRLRVSLRRFPRRFFCGSVSYGSVDDRAPLVQSRLFIT